MSESRFGDDRLLDGGPGEDVLIGNAGADRQILGGEGQDLLSGGTGNDGLDGGPDNDVLFPGTGQANGLRALGGPGEDTLYVGASARLVDCGPGGDRVVLSGYADETIRVGGSVTQFVDCEQRVTGADLGQAPSLLRVLGR